MSNPKKDLEIFADELARKAEEEVRQFIADYCEIKIAEELQGIQMHIDQLYQSLGEVAHLGTQISDILNEHLTQGATNGSPHTEPSSPN